jgi:hypothetical protein
MQNKGDDSDGVGGVVLSAELYFTLDANGRYTLVDHDSEFCGEG